MNPEFVAYCDELGLGSELIAKVDALFRHFKAISGEDITAIFVSDVTKQDVTRAFTAVTFFTDQFAYHVVNFVGDPALPFILPLRFVVHQYNAEKYNAGESPQPESKFLFKSVPQYGSQVILELRATGTNCASHGHNQDLFTETWVDSRLRAVDVSRLLAYNHRWRQVHTMKDHPP